MHGSLHIIYAPKPTVRAVRRSTATAAPASFRRPFGSLRARV